MAKRKASKRKRGRPPAGDFSKLTAVTSLRMPEDLRQQLEEARKARAKKLNRDVGFSQELLYRLRNSFNRERDEARDPALRALCHLIGKAADAVTFPFPMRLPGDLGPLWHSHSFLFDAFKLAVHKLLDADELKPGKAKSPTTRQVELYFRAVVAERYQTPEALADFVVDGILHSLRGGVPPSKKSEMWGETTPWDSADDYQMLDARRDLGIKSQGEKS